jgi:hypothetical protein
MVYSSSKYKEFKLSHTVAVKCVVADIDCELVVRLTMRICRRSRVTAL